MTDEPKLPEWAQEALASDPKAYWCPVLLCVEYPHLGQRQVGEDEWEDRDTGHRG